MNIMPLDPDGPAIICSMREDCHQRATTQAYTSDQGWFLCDYHRERMVHLPTVRMWGETVVLA